MLTKRTYNQVLAAIKQFKVRNFDVDRKENPTIAPCEYRSSLERIIEDTARKNGERVSQQTVQGTLEYLCKLNILVPFVGGYTFKSDEVLPTEEEVRTQAVISIRKLGVFCN